MTKKELEKLIKFFYTGGAIYRNGNYDLTADVALLAASEFLKHGVNLLSEYDSLRKMYDSCYSATQGHEYRVRLLEDEIKLWGRAVENETFWNIHAIYDDQKISFISSVVEEDTAYYEEEREYRKRRKRASACTLNPARRARIMKRDGYKCQTCGTTEQLGLDHIISVRKGGSNDDDNLQVLCHSCNSRKGDK